MDYVFEFEKDAKKEESSPPTWQWLQTIVLPSQPLKHDPSQPLLNLLLEWIHCYSTTKYSSNIFCCIDGGILYNIKRTLVERNTKNKHQQFYQEAKDKIISLVLCPTKNVCVIGKMGQTPSINVFNYETMDTMHLISGHDCQAISVLKFDPSGKHLVSIGHDLCNFTFFWMMNNDSPVSNNAYFGDKGKAHGGGASIAIKLVDGGWGGAAMKQYNKMLIRRGRTVAIFENTRFWWWNEFIP
eukprot:9681202-Ditylum_brightwellii.AAC.1